MGTGMDLSKEYGIVLEGGGAKGAYQIGAWIALKEAGVKIRGIAGTSVGALNGALICMGDEEKARRIWENMLYSRVMDVDDEKMHRFVNHQMNLGEYTAELLTGLSAGGIDVTPLRRLIEENISEEKIHNSRTELFVTTYSVEERKDLTIDLKEIDPGLITDYLLASAYIFPIFKNEKVEGKTCIDAGAFNNLPVDILLDRGYKDIITIRIFGVGRTKKVHPPEDTTILSIEPRVNLGNIIDFDYRKSRRNLTIGYYDAKRLILGLSGKIYYIEEKEEECYYLNQFLQLREERIELLMGRFHVGKREQWMRKLTEQILPMVAAELKLEREWTYRELYLAVLEATAKLCRVQKYRVYGLEELQNLTAGKLERMKNREELPAFVNFIYQKEEEA